MKKIGLKANQYDPLLGQSQYDQAPSSWPDANKAPRPPRELFFHAKDLNGLRTAYPIENILKWQEAVDNDRPVCLVTIRLGRIVYDEEGREKMSEQELLVVSNPYDEITALVTKFRSENN